MKKSIRAARMARHHKRFGNASLSLVSLMDIFTILVFFLLFNSSGDHQLPSSKAIKLPESVAEEKPRDNLVILVSNTDIIVSGKRVANVSNLLESGEAVIPALKNHLLQLADNHWDKEALASEDGVEVTILADKQVPYSLLKIVMHTLTDTPYRKISLAVGKKSAPKKAESEN